MVGMLKDDTGMSKKQEMCCCAVVAHSMAQEAFQSVTAHTIATSSSLAGNQFSFSCSKV